VYHYFCGRDLSEDYEIKQEEKKVIASFNNRAEACDMLCGKGRLASKAERYGHCPKKSLEINRV